MHRRADEAHIGRQGSVHALLLPTHGEAARRERAASEFDDYPERPCKGASFKPYIIGRHEDSRR
jgi:hypothetical protein